jgi:DNA topoisomerase III
LYEQHKLVTYPRTDSKHLSSDITDTLKIRLKAISIQPYRMSANKALNRPLSLSNAYVDDRKVSDHHAIIPTEETPFLQRLQDKEVKIYDLIVKRFLAIFLPPFQYEQTKVELKIGNELFHTKGKRITDRGWKEVYGFDNEEDQLLGKMEESMELNVLSLVETEGKTTPPSRFNEGTLLSAMENPGKYMKESNKELLETIGETGGLGTVATRADIIEKLFNSGVMELQGKEIHLTSKGKQLLDLAPDELRSPSLTAEWELKLDKIAKGSLKKQEFINEIKDYTNKSVHEIKNSNKKYSHDNLTGSKCPDCGNLMLEIKNKNGKKLVCQDRECGHRKNISKKTNARCPNCHKRLELRGEGDGQLFVCVCGHKEKLSTFNDRRKKEKNNKASKRDVNKYLKTQQNDEPANTALADALAKLKLDQ